jgi:hypothetical protein
MRFEQIRVRGWISVLFFSLSTILLEACGSVSGGASNPGVTCSGANQAQIMVGDGFLSSLCGCMGVGEEPGKAFSSGQLFTCHLAQSNTQVIFYFGRTLNPHQIVPDGTPSLTPTPWIEGRDRASHSFPVFLGQSGVTFSFKDVTTGGRGQIVVP